MRSWKFFPLLSFSCALTVVFALACESGDDEAPKSLSEACDACLAREACSVPWQTCLDDDDCKQYVACVLRAECYSRAPESGCEEQAGCALETESDAAGRASDDFEACARTECAAACGFVEP